MRRLLAIARLAVSNAVRSRVVLSLLLLLLLAVIALPLTIKSDGTLAGHVRIVLSYTLGVSFLILAVATLWAGCAAVSLEIRDKQAHLLVTKPVTRLEIWFGKWLGLLFLDALLLGMCGLLIYGMTLWTTRPGVLAPDDQRQLREEVLVAMRTVPPVLEGLDEQVEQHMAALRASGRMPPDLHEAHVREEMLLSLERREFIVPPQGERTWVFQLDTPLGKEPSVLLGFRLSVSRPETVSVAGAWRVGPLGEPEGAEFAGTYTPRKPIRIPLPSDLLAGRRQIAVTYRNVDAEDMTVLFDPGDGVSLLVYATGFELNLLKALLILFARLAFLAAVGLTAGALLSTPVAMLVAFVAALTLQMSNYVESMAHADSIFSGHAHGGPLREPGLWDHLFGLIFKAMNVLIHPLQDPNTLELLGTSQAIPWPAVGTALAMKLIVYAGLLAGLASWLMGRREIGLPT